MGKIRTFIYSIVKSATSVDYYYDITQASVFFSIKFFIGFCVIYSIVTGLVLYREYVLPIRPIIQSLPNQVVETVYPEDLVIYIQNGQVSISQPQPFFIPADRLQALMVQLKDQILGANSKSFDYLLVIDTSATTQDFYDYNTFALLTADTFYYLDPVYGRTTPGQVHINAIPLTGITAIINQQTFHALAAEVIPYLQAAIPFVLIPICIFLVFTLPYLFLVYTLMFALLMLFVAKIIDTTLSYSKCFQISIHLFASVSFAMLALKVVGVNMSIPLLRLTIMLIAGIIIVAHIKELSLHRRQQLKVS